MTPDWLRMVIAGLLRIVTETPAAEPGLPMSAFNDPSDALTLDILRARRDGGAPSAAASPPPGHTPLLPSERACDCAGVWRDARYGIWWCCGKGRRP